MTIGINDVRNMFARKLKNKQFSEDGNLEITGISFKANEETIFGEVNSDYVAREIEWYESQSLNVNDIPGEVPSIWKRIASSKGHVNSNYGYLLYSSQNGSQYESVLKELVKNKESRRAIAIYTRPTMHAEVDNSSIDDFICTNTVQYMIRDNELVVVVQMRSNDVVYGYRNDFAWQKYVATNLLTQLTKVYPEMNGIINITWQVGSLHVYPRHFKLVEQFENNG